MFAPDASPILQSHKLYMGEYNFSRKAFVSCPKSDILIRCESINSLYEKTK